MITITFTKKEAEFLLNSLFADLQLDLDCISPDAKDNMEYVKNAKLIIQILNKIPGFKEPQICDCCGLPDVSYFEFEKQRAINIGYKPFIDLFK